MDKFVLILAKQNPTMEIKCANPECQKESHVETVDFFSSNDTYTYHCPYCDKITSIGGIDEQLNNLKNQFKSLGIRW